MPNTDPRVDAYIAKSADFAKPVLQHLRKLVHEGCPEAQETIKWGFPFFDYKGPLCAMNAFKAHCGFGFWKAALLPDPKGILAAVEETAAGNFGKITSLKDLPADKTILAFIKAAKKLNDDGIKPAPVKKKAPAKELVVPDYILKAVRKNKSAAAVFEGFSNSHKKEYVEWIEDAKTEETRNRRMETMMQLLAEGKTRNWKYQTK